MTGWQSSLEERKHRMDMAKVYKIVVTGKGKEESETWFTMERAGQRMTRGNAHPFEPEKTSSPARSEEELLLTESC